MPPDQVLSHFVHSGGAYAVAALLGALFGSFANVCIYRWPPSEEFPGGRSVVKPASHCSVCGVDIRWYDNLPFLSYLILRGRCRACGTHFSPRYLLVELATSVLFAVSYWVAVSRYASAPIAAQMAVFTIFSAFSFVMVVITFIDLDHKLILNKLTYPAIPIFYLLGLALPGADYTRGIIGLVVGYGVVRAIADGYYYLTGREAMGYGDGKLLAIIGALHGWQAVVVSLFLGSLVGSVISISVLVVQRRRGVEPSDSGELGPAAEEAVETQSPAKGPSIGRIEVPFGPFLAVGALTYTFCQPWLRRTFGALWGDPLM